MIVSSITVAYVAVDGPAYAAWRPTGKCTRGSRDDRTDYLTVITRPRPREAVSATNAFISEKNSAQ